MNVKAREEIFHLAHSQTATEMRTEDQRGSFTQVSHVDGRGPDSDHLLMFSQAVNMELDKEQQELTLGPLWDARVTDRGFPLWATVPAQSSILWKEFVWEQSLRLTLDDRTPFYTTLLCNTSRETYPFLGPYKRSQKPS